MINRIFALTLCVLMQLSLLSSSAFAQDASAQEKAASSLRSQTAFDKLVDEYFQFHPTAGTQAGLHQYDMKLEDFSRAAIDAETAGLAQFQEKFSSIQSSQLSLESEGDLDVLISSIQARLLELQSIQMWRKDPDVYISNLSYSVFLIMRRNFAPAADRLRSVIAREREIPRVLAAARKNVSNPPRVYTQVAL